MARPPLRSRRSASGTSRPYFSFTKTKRSPASPPKRLPPPSSPPPVSKPAPPTNTKGPTTPQRLPPSPLPPTFPSDIPPPPPPSPARAPAREHNRLDPEPDPFVWVCFKKIDRPPAPRDPMLQCPTPQRVIVGFDGPTIDVGEDGGGGGDDDDDEFAFRRPGRGVAPPPPNRVSTDATASKQTAEAACAKLDRIMPRGAPLLPPPRTPLAPLIPLQEKTEPPKDSDEGVEIPSRRSAKRLRTSTVSLPEDHPPAEEDLCVAWRRLQEAATTLSRPFPSPLESNDRPSWEDRFSSTGFVAPPRRRKLVSSAPSALPPAISTSFAPFPRKPFRISIAGLAWAEHKATRGILERLWRFSSLRPDLAKELRRPSAPKSGWAALEAKKVKRGSGGETMGASRVYAQALVTVGGVTHAQTCGSGTSAEQSLGTALSRHVRRDVSASSFSSTSSRRSTSSCPSAPCPPTSVRPASPSLPLGHDNGPVFLSAPPALEHRRPTASSPAVESLIKVLRSSAHQGRRPSSTASIATSTALSVPSSSSWTSAPSEVLSSWRRSSIKEFMMGSVASIVSMASRGSAASAV